MIEHGIDNPLCHNNKFGIRRTVCRNNCKQWKENKCKLGIK